MEGLSVFADFPPQAGQRRISGARTIGGGDTHRFFTAAQNCSVTAALSSATSQPFVSAFSWPPYARSEVLFDGRVRFPVGLGQLHGGRAANVVGNRLPHAGVNVAQVALHLGGEARLGVLAVGCDEVLAEGNPLTCVAGLDVGRLRFVMQAVGEFVGVGRISPPRAWRGCRPRRRH